MRVLSDASLTRATKFLYFRAAMVSSALNINLSSAWAFRSPCYFNLLTIELMEEPIAERGDCKITRSYPLVKGD
jgi:hypothetical protein